VSSASLAIHDRKGFGAGLLFAVIGAAAWLYARRYGFGSAEQMGPGFFPSILSIALIVLGGVNVARSLGASAVPVGRVGIKPALLVTAGVGSFAAGVDRIGLVPSIAALVLLGALAGTRFRAREAIPVAVALALLSAAVFVYGLKLPFALF
jgi:Tripartite tricarboxylate transporter TctB family